MTPTTVPMRVVDLLDLVEKGRDDGGRPWHLKDLGRSAQSALYLLRVAPRERWEAPDSERESRAILLLEGVASFHVDEWRESAAAGQLVVAAAGASLGIENESEAPLWALLNISPAPRVPYA